MHGNNTCKIRKNRIKFEKNYTWNVIYIIKSGNLRFWSFCLKAPTEDAETTWLGNEFQRFITRLEK